MTRNEYIKRLEHMLTSNPEPCGACPGAPRYDGSESAYFHLGVWDEQTTNCELCQDFVDLYFIRPKADQFRPPRACPCKRIGAERAIERAWKYLRQWKNGKHKWQR